MLNALLSGFCTIGGTEPQGHRHFFGGVSRLRHPTATLMGGNGGDAHIPAIVRNRKALLYLQRKRGGGGPTARLAPSHYPGASIGRGYNHIAWSHSSKARISTTKQHLDNHFADVKAATIPDLPIYQAYPNPLPNARAKYEQDAQVWTAPPGMPTWAVCHEKNSVLPKQGSLDCGIAAVAALSFQA